MPCLMESRSSRGHTRNICSSPLHSLRQPETAPFQSHRRSLCMEHPLYTKSDGSTSRQPKLLILIDPRPIQGRWLSLLHLLMCSHWICLCWTTRDHRERHRNESETSSAAGLPLLSWIRTGNLPNVWLERFH